MTVSSERSAVQTYGRLARQGWLRVLLGALGALALLSSLKTRDPGVGKEPISDKYHITDEQYYAMPQLFEMDEYYVCVARGGVYCYGQFELIAPPENQLLLKIQHYSEDRVRHSNHSLVYRGVCLSRRCPQSPQGDDHEWFTSCVKTTLMMEYGVSANLTQLKYCTRELQGNKLTSKGAAFIGFLVFLVVLATISSALDFNLSDESKKDIGWALSWSVRRSWRTLTRPVQYSGADLRFLDGLRAISMLVLILLHAAVFSIFFNVADTRFYEKSVLPMITNNLALAVQIFFIVSSFLMANKVLQQENMPAKKNFVKTMQKRIVRILPSLMIWILYMATLHEYWGSGPMWHVVVGTEVETCQQYWWLNLLFLNNFNYQLKCQGQTWYLAADMQLYVTMLVLTLLLRGRRAVPILAVLLSVSVIVCAVMAYAWDLLPSYAIHTPDNFRAEYVGVAAFDLLYQAPWGNAFASLTGLLLAHAHRSLQTSKQKNHCNQLFQWATRLAGPCVILWTVLWPCIHPQDTPTRLRSALMVGLIGPVFCLLVAVIIMAFLQGVDSPLRRFLSSRVFSVMARLSLPVMLVHFPLAGVMLAVREGSENVGNFKIIFNTFGVWSMSYAAAAALALLVELPTQKLYSELSGAGRDRDKRAD